MEHYIYQADYLCKECGYKLKKTLPLPKDFISHFQGNWDSDDYPKGPYEVTESDSPQHCSECGLFLENPLTEDGQEYVKECIVEIPNNKCVKQWIEFYDYLT